MIRHHRILTAAVAATVTLLTMLGASPASAAPAGPAWPIFVCHGTPHSPGHLTGRFRNVVVHGVCVVNRGPALVRHNVEITRNSALLAAFGRRHSRLVVKGSIFVDHGATLILGCEPKAATCFDDPHPKHPSLFSHGRVGGSVIAIRALGIVVHASWIGRSILQFGGGGGVTCKPMGIFAANHTPVFSAYEDNSIRGFVRVRRVHSCWLGVIRNRIGHNATISLNVMADHDAMEIVSNVVRHDLTCFRNHPRVQFGDSLGKPNLVGRHARFECGFHVILPNPAGQHVHFSHISLHLH